MAKNNIVSKIVWIIYLVNALGLVRPDDSTTASELIEDDDEYYADLSRWSMFLPRFVENWCFERCRDGGKPFSRLIGARCQCLCPINAAQLELCPPNGGIVSCYDFCQSIGYYKGGGCLYNESCFCFCRRHQPYNASVIYQ